MCDVLHRHAHKFVTSDGALIGAIAAGVSQCRGGRVTVLYTVAVVDQQGRAVPPGAEGGGPVTRYFMMPYAVRFCSGHDVNRQPFVDPRRLNTMMTYDVIRQVATYVEPRDIVHMASSGREWNEPTCQNKFSKCL